MPSYNDSFLQTQIGRGMRVHYDTPPGMRRKSTQQAGLFMGVEQGRMKMHVAAPGRENETVLVARDADQPAFAEQDGGSLVWWEWTGPQR